MADLDLRALLAVSLLAVAGCPKQSAGSIKDYEAVPHLPSPKAGTYAQVPTESPDPVIAAITRGKRWDASLSGAASGLALAAVHRRGGLASWEVREAAWRAGYPYVIDQVRGWSTPQKSPPPDDLLAWVEAQDAETDIGLVRARGPSGEAWVGLAARPRASVGVLPRQVSLGGSVVLPVIPGGAFFVADADGRLIDGSLEIEQPFRLNQSGEWLFEVRDDDGLVALFPIYAGVTPPEVDLLAPPDRQPVGPADAITRAEQLLTEVREIYGARPWTREPMLDTAARAMMRNPDNTASEMAARLGFDPNRFWRWECRSGTVEDCLDSMFWNPRARPALLTDTRYLGLAAATAAGGFHLVVLISAE